MSFKNNSKIKNILLFVSMICLIAAGGCVEKIKDDTITAPIIETETTQYLALSEEQRVMLSGNYLSATAGNIPGKLSVFVFSGGNLYIYTKSNSYYAFSLSGGIFGNEIIYKGAPVFGDISQKASVMLKASFTSRQQMNAAIIGRNIKFNFEITDGNNIIKSELSYTSAFINKPENFIIFAHRGGETFYASPNSITALANSDETGINAVELDVNISKDGVPFIFHDDVFDNLNVNSTFCLGNVTDFTISAMKSFATLKDGTRIPTLEEALEYIYNSNNIKNVWLDIKNPATFGAAIVIINAYHLKALQNGKTLNLYIGINSAENYYAFELIKNKSLAKLLCELSPEMTMQLNADVWAPQWNGDKEPYYVKQFQSNGKKVFFWTVDEADFLNLYGEEVLPDGIVTNAPVMMIYEYLSKIQ